MKTSVIMTSMLSAWTIAIAYYQIEMMTGVEIRLMLYAAIIVMAAGLYMGLYTKDNETSKEEA